MASDDRLYFRQLLSGRDFAAGDMMAQQMRNFAYLIGDRETGEQSWWTRPTPPVICWTPSSPTA
jgi:hypothetical protein